MSAAATTFANPAVKTAPRHVSGWAHLTRLLPSVARPKTEVLIGLVTQTGMGITGTLLPLLLAVITDCIKAAETPRAQSRRITQLSLGYRIPTDHLRQPR